MTVGTEAYILFKSAVIDAWKIEYRGEVGALLLESMTMSIAFPWS
jgi:hypothetical protein